MVTQLVELNTDVHLPKSLWYEDLGMSLGDFLRSLADSEQEQAAIVSSLELLPGFDTERELLSNTPPDLIKKSYWG